MDNLRAKPKEKKPATIGDLLEGMVINGEMFLNGKTEKEVLQKLDKYDKKL